MPFFDDLVAKQQRQTGEPQAPKVSGGAPQPSKPNTTVNPPAAASGPVGRPSSPAPPFAGSAGPALPASTPQAARPAATPSSGAGTPATPAPSQPATPQPATGPGQPAQPTSIGPSFQLQLDHVPSRAELAEVPPGVKVTTPYGEVDATGKLTLSEQGKVQYQQAMLKKQKEYGFHPFAGDPNAPPPPVKLGRPSFNPFTWRWTK